jgi:hypothetical protein
MKIQIIKTITFLVSAPYVAWEARRDDEVEYYKNLTESQEARKEVEKWLYQELQQKLRNGPAAEREKVIVFYRLLKNALNQGIEGVVESLHFARWLRTKINSSEQQEAQLDKLIQKTQRLLKEHESQKPDEFHQISEADYEVINQQQIAYEKEKQAWQKLLIELESQLEASTVSNWINYDLVEEEISHGDYEYTLLTSTRKLKAELAEELALEREECAKALDKAREWRERQIKEIVSEKDKQIQQLQNELQREKDKNAELQQLIEEKSQIAQVQQNFPFNPGGK